MNSAIDQLNVAAEAWTGLTFAVLWQSTVLAVLIALAALALRRSSPAVRYWLWQILAIKLLVMPFWAVSVPWPDWFGRTDREDVISAAEDGATASSRSPEGFSGPDIERLPFLDEASAVPSERQSHWLTRVGWQTWLLLAWAVLVLWQVVRIAVQRRRLGRLLSAARPAEAALTARVRSVAGELNLKRVPAVLVTDSDCSPFVCGVRRPVLVLPANLATSLDETQLRHVLFHELAHVKRGDLVWGWIPEIARLVYFFHPVAHWMAYRLRLERELACDQIAMTHTGRDARAYAETLVQVVSRQCEPAVLKAAVGTAQTRGGYAVTAGRDSAESAS